MNEKCVVCEFELAEKIYSKVLPEKIIEELSKGLPHWPLISTIFLTLFSTSVLTPVLNFINIH